MDDGGGEEESATPGPRDLILAGATSKTLEGGGVLNIRALDADRTCVNDKTVVSRLTAELCELLGTVVLLARTGNGRNN